EPVFRTYPIRRADVTEVTRSLDALEPGVVVNEDTRSDTIHIFATPEQHSRIERLIREMDGGGNLSIDVIRLTRTDPTWAAAMLTNLFINDGDQAPSIQPDRYARALVVRGT